jgi:hypothetical protein
VRNREKRSQAERRSQKYNKQELVNKKENQIELQRRKVLTEIREPLRDVKVRDDVLIKFSFYHHIFIPFYRHGMSERGQELWDFLVQLEKDMKERNAPRTRKTLPAPIIT